MKGRWWHIYACFEPASEDEACSIPHQGQVIHYYRKMRGFTQKDVAGESGWSEQEMQRIEQSPDGPGDRQCSIALARYLRIPGPLLALSQEEVGPETPIYCNSDGEDLTEQERALLDHYSFLHGSEPVSEEALWLCWHALEACTDLFWPLESEGISPLTLLDRLHRAIRSQWQYPGGLMHIQSLSSDQIRLGLNSIDSWIKQFEFAALLSKGLRRAQYLDLQHVFASVACISLKILQDAPISPERHLSYEMLALRCAHALENAENITWSLISRASVYLEQRKDAEALQDIEDSLFYLDIVNEVLVRGGTHLVFQMDQLLRLAEGRTHRRLRELVREAIRITRATGEDLRPWNGIIKEEL
jgi:transcriptional regulator with XRE-family HTH domain